MFQNINKLHITFGTLSLMDNEDRILATELFQESREIVEQIRYESLLSSSLPMRCFILFCFLKIQFWRLDNANKGSGDNER